MKNEPVDGLSSQAVYEIRLEGALSDQWSDWFDGMQIGKDAEGNTTLTGSVTDQAALHGLLDKVRDVGLTLLGVTKLIRQDKVK